MAGLDAGDNLVNPAVSGYKTADILNHLQISVLNVLEQWRPANIVYSLMIGTNDIHSNIPVATIYANIQSICSQVTANNRARMIVFTILPGNPWTDETQRQTLNTLIRNGGACTYTVADVGNDPTIGQAGQNGNLTYYNSDALHPTAAGDAIIGISYLRPALQSLGFQ